MNCLAPMVCVRVRKALQILGATIGVLLIALPLFSQGNTGRILGDITDQSGGYIAGATVIITDTQRGISRTLTTDDSGSYNAPNLIPGTYKVRAEAKGFKSVEHQNILLQVGSEIHVDLTLNPGEKTETITVTEQIPMVETTNATLGGTLDNQTINDLPLNGRNYENLLTLRPGVQIYPGGGGWSQSTNGIRPEDNVYMVDGLINNEPFSGMSLLNGAPIAGDASTVIPIDAIQEFRVEENPRAQYGWKPGGITNVGLKSGTNSVHGTAYAFGRADSWDARNYFDPPPLPKAPLDLEQFGGTAGGPIKKDKIFWFAGYEGQRYNVGSTTPLATPSLVPGLGFQSSIPDTLKTMVILPGGGAMVGNGISQLSLNLAGCPPPPLPTDPLSAWATYTCTGKNLAGGHQQMFPANMSATSGNFLPGLVSTNRQDNALAKFDYHLSDHDTLNGFYFFGQMDGTWNDAPNEVQPQWRSVIHDRAQVASMNWTWTPNSRWVNELRGGWNRLYQPTFGADKSQPASAYGINTGITNPLYGGFPQLRIFSFNLAAWQLGVGWPKIQGPDTVLQVQDHVSYLRGKHSFKFGGEIVYNRGNDAGFQDAKGLVQFHKLADFLAGNLQKAAILVGDPLRHVHTYGFAPFVQDDWRVTPTVTVNLGLRYELNTVLKEDHNLFGSFDPNLGVLQQVGKQISSPYNGDHNNFAPRLGIAWDVKGNGKTVIRAGGGIVYDQLSYNVYLAESNTLGLGTVPTGAIINATGGTSGGNIAVAATTYQGGPGTLLNWTVAGPIFPTGQVNCFTSPCNTMTVDRNLRTPYVTNWTLDVQRAVTNSMSLEVAYVGNHGTKLVGLTDINQPAVGAGWSPTALAACDAPALGAALYSNCSPDPAQPLRPYTLNGKAPYLNYINLLSNIDRSNYNALQVTLTQRTYHGLSFTAGYTYAHALDNASSNWGSTTALVSTLRNKEYASGDYDVRHRFTLTTTYAIPGKKVWGQLLEGWQINSIATLQGGQPWGTQDTGDDFTGTNEVNNPSSGFERWDFFGKTSDFTSHQIPLPWFAPNPLFNGGTNLDPSTNAACNAQARKLDGGMTTGPAQASLFNFGCYAKGTSILIPPPFGSAATSGRNIFRDKGFRNWDLSVYKNWKFRERLTAQFRAEFFNVLNHPNFANPYDGRSAIGLNDPSVPGSLNPLTPGFGCGCFTPDQAGVNPVLGSGANRAIQLGLKFIF